MPALEIPLTILTGWLGAGKTTLMHHVVATLSAANKKVAWIQNEFAAGGVEDSVVLSGDEVFTDIVELANGCVCCTVKSDFVAGLEALVKQKRFDCIFLECSGLADPGALAGMFWQDDALEAPVYLDAIVALVDAQHFIHQLGAPEAAQVMRQLAFADRIVVNKLDLVDDTQIASIMAAVRNVNSVAPVMQATRSNIDLSFIVDTRAFNAHSVDAAATSMSDTPTHQCTSECSHASSPCAHDDSIRTLVLEQRDADVRIDLIKFRQFLADLLWEPAANGYAPAQEIFRMKAVLHSLPDSDIESDDESSSDSDSSESDQPSMSTSGSRHYLQAVQQLFEIERGLPWAHTEVPFTRMIVIGRHIDEPRLSAAFAKSWIRL